MKEYQQKRMKEFVMPETVYRQALWAAKDLPRMKKRIEEMTEKINAISIQTVRESRATGAYSDRTGNMASELASLTVRKEAIESALDSVPEQYRDGICRKLFEGLDFGDEFHPNTWKKWQQVYLYNVAVKLGLY